MPMTSSASRFLQALEMQLASLTVSGSNLKRLSGAEDDGDQDFATVGSSPLCGR